MADVFISYARADKARVAPLVAAIEARGWSVWWDPEITPGQEFDDRISPGSCPYGASAESTMRCASARIDCRCAWSLKLSA